MANANSKKIMPTKGFKDTFNFHRINGKSLITDMELPYIGRYEGPIPKKVINITRHPRNPQDYFVHHYMYDYCFDGRNGFGMGAWKIL